VVEIQVAQQLKNQIQDKEGAHKKNPKNLVKLSQEKALL